MSKFTFTKSAIDALPIPSKDECGKVGYRLHWDTQLPGFGLQVRPTGLKTFILLYRGRSGRSRKLTIGRYGRITLDQARAAARRRFGDVALGDDPQAEKKRLRAMKTFGEVFDAYLKEHLEANRSEHAVRSGKRVKRLIEKTLARQLVVDMTDVEVRSALQPYARQAGNFNLLRTYVAAAWEWGRAFGHIEKILLNPVEHIENMPSMAQARAVTPGEYRRIQDAIDELLAERRNDPARLLACLFVVYTGCRPIEAVRLERKHVDRASGVIRLYEHKTMRVTGKPKVFWLTPPILDIIDRADALYRLRRADTDFVFPRRSKQKASNWLAKTWSSVKARANVDIDLRQMRSGFINAADDAGMTEQQVAGITQHASLATIRRHYRVVNQKRAQADAGTVVEFIHSFRRIG